MKIYAQQLAFKIPKMLLTLNIKNYAQLVDFIRKKTIIYVLSICNKKINEKKYKEFIKRTFFILYIVNTLCMINPKCPLIAIRYLKNALNGIFNGGKLTFNSKAIDINTNLIRPIVTLFSHG